MEIRFSFPDFPTKVQVTNKRRPVYYKQGDTIPLKYRNQWYRFKDNKLWSSQDEAFVIKNKASLEKPRFQPLSYNKVGSRQKMTVLKKLKEYMEQYIPRNMEPLPKPCMIECFVYDMPLPLTKDLDNMHIYYKAFLDLLVEKKLLEDDSKQFVTGSGGFTFTPCEQESKREMIFVVKEDTRKSIRDHLMYQYDKPVMTLVPEHGILPKGYMLEESTEVSPGNIRIFGDHMQVRFGKTRPTKADTHRVFRKAYEACMNGNRRLLIKGGIYDQHQEYIEWLLEHKVPVTVILRRPND